LFPLPSLCFQHTPFHRPADSKEHLQAGKESGGRIADGSRESVKSIGRVVPIDRGHTYAVIACYN